MQQNIMRNVIEDGFLAKAQEDNVAASLQKYAVVKAHAQQEATYAIQGGMAQKSVAMLKIVIELILYGMFPFVAVLGVLPLCSSILRQYAMAILWLQSWTPTS